MDPMKRLLLLTIAVALAGGAYSCVGTSGDDWKPPQVVKIQSGEKVSSFFPSWGSWLSDAEEGAPQGLLLRDRDYVVPEHGDVPAPYRARDGQALKMTFNDWSARIGETTVSIQLNKEGLAWVGQASERQLADVRQLSVPNEIDAAALSALKRIAAANRNVDLSCDSEASLLQALPLFRPRAIFLDEHAGAAAWSALANQPQVETLTMAATEPGSLDVLPKLPNLRRLFLIGWDVEKAGPLPAGLSSLEALTIMADDGIRDLAALRAAPTGLEELSLLGLKGVPNLAVLDRLTNLQTLIIRADESLTDLSSLASLQQLRWVGLPSTMTQEQFAAFVSAHPELSILDMMGNESVKDLSPLSSLKNLNGLILGGPYENLKVVQGLTSLRFVGISKEIWGESPEQVEAIRKALPDALVVRVSPFCLGSGWILLLIPAMFAASGIPRRWRMSVGL